MHIALCTSHNEHCTMHIALYTLYYAHCTVHIALCTLHYKHYTYHIALCTVHCALCTLYMHITLCTLHFHIALCSLHYVYCTMYIALCTLHYAHCTLHISQCTLHYVNCTALSPVRNRNSASPTPQHHLQSEANRLLSLPKPASESRDFGRIWRICNIFNSMWASIHSFNL